MKKEQRYTPEFKAEAVKLVTEQGLSVERAAKRLGIPRGSLGNWATAANKGATLGQAAPGARSATELEAENAPATRATRGSPNGARFPKKSDGVLRQGVSSRYAVVKKWRSCFPVQMMCRLLDVSRSGYYRDDDSIALNVFEACS